jgi:hypothetical protein
MYESFVHTLHHTTTTLYCKNTSHKYLKHMSIQLQFELHGKSQSQTNSCFSQSYTTV